MIELLVSGLFVFVAISLWLMIENRGNPKFLLWFVPLALGLTVSIYVSYTTLLGKPKLEIPSQETSYHLAHWVDEPNWIYLWVIHNTDKEPTSYKIPYEREMHDSLEQIEGRKQMGEEVIIEGVGENFKRSQKIREGDLDGKFRKAHTLGGNLEFYIWNHETEMPSKEEQTE